MLDIGWTELLLIGVVALIVVGPKDLPRMFRALGKFTGKMRGMAREFQRAMDQAADESGLKEVSSSLKSAASAGKAAANPLREMSTRIQSGFEAAVKPSKILDETSPAPETDAQPGSIEASDEAGGPVSDEADEPAKGIDSGVLDLIPTPPESRREAKPKVDADLDDSGPEKATVKSDT